MRKILSAYRTYTAQAIKDRASVPTPANMHIVGSTVECANINVYQVRDAIGISALDLHGQANSSNVNIWSCFGPVARSITGSGYDKVLVNTVVTPDELFEFAGYNHNAPTPGWQSGGQAAAEANNWVNSGSQATCNANINIGEIDWEGMGAVGVAMLIFDVTGNIVGWGYTALSGLGSNFTLAGTTTISGGIVLDKLDWYAMAFLVDQEILNPEDVISAVVCRVPNISTWEINLKVKQASTWYYDGDGQTIPSPWVQNGSAGMNFTTGYFDIGMIACKQNKQIKIYARLFNWLDEVIGTGYIVGSESSYYSYSAMEDITGNAYLGMVNIPSYGYRVVVYFEESS